MIADPAGPRENDERAEVFQTHRPLLLGLAYRLLGSMWDAEDLVQDAYLRWMRTDRAVVREPRAFLATVITRLALDQLKSARVTRERYSGPWLPEPVLTSELDPLDTAELRDTVAYATLHMMERLSPPERAVFVLREAFSFGYEDIAAMVGVSTPTCRQLHHRGAGRLRERCSRFQPSPDEHLRLVNSFLRATQSGDLTALTAMLSDDVIAWNDGGGRVRAALRPIEGRDRVVAFLAGLLSRYSIGDSQLEQVNGELAIWLRIGGQEQLVLLDLGDGLICGIYAVLNPDKLRHVRPPNEATIR